MRKVIYLLVALMFACASEASAQKWLKSVGKALNTADKVLSGDASALSSKKSDQKKQTKTTSSKKESAGIEKASFTKEQVLRVDMNAVGTPVDLGLSVMWSDRNLGATQQPQFGEYLDMSEDYVKKYWGDEWRLPTEAEWNELFTKCTVEHMPVQLKGDTYIPDVAGYLLLQGPSGKVLFLPCSGYERRSKDQVGAYEGCYWLSDMRKRKNEDGLNYVCMFFQAEDVEGQQHGKLAKYYTEERMFANITKASMRPVYVGPQAAKATTGTTATKSDPGVFGSNGYWYKETVTVSRSVSFAPQGVKDEFDEKLSYGVIVTTTLPNYDMDEDIITKLTINGNTADIEYECDRAYDNEHNKGKAQAIYDPVKKTMTLKIIKAPDGCWAESWGPLKFEKP